MGKNNATLSIWLGVSTSSFQIEGGLRTDGKGEDVWQELVEKHPELIEDKSSPEDGPNSYYFFDKDLAILKELKVNFYRFSMSWARILPTGDVSSLNKAAIKYYNDVINKLTANGIHPVVTINHFDLPTELQKIGGFTNPLFVKYAEAFADLLFKTFGDKVHMWVTFNEPSLYCDFSYGSGVHAPLINASSVGTYLCGDTILKAHANIYHLYKEKYFEKQMGIVGIALFSNYYYSERNDTALVNRALEFEMGWFANPIFNKTGGYPDIMNRTISANSAKEGRLWSRLPELTPYWINRIRGSADFLGYNYYSAQYVKPGNSKISNNPSWRDDVNLTMTNFPYCKPNVMFCSVPKGLEDMLRWIKKRYDNVPVLILENGFADDGRIDDFERTAYIKDHLQAVLNAMNDDCNVVGYSAWSLMDSFEWLSGYTLKMGLYSVNLTSPQKERIPKLSGKYYKKVIETRKLD